MYFASLFSLNQFTLDKCRIGYHMHNRIFYSLFLCILVLFFYFCFCFPVFHTSWNWFTECMEAFFPSMQPFSIHLNWTRTFAFGFIANKIKCIFNSKLYSMLTYMCIFIQITLFQNNKYSNFKLVLNFQWDYFICLLNILIIIMNLPH